jgi:hypothetical protein
MKTFLSLARSSKPIPQCPEAGQGVHRWCLEAAWQCRFSNIAPAEAVAVLHSMITRRPQPANEIESAVALAYGAPMVSHGAPATFHRRRKWPAFNAEQREAVIATGGGLHDLWECSPCRFEDGEPHTEQILDALFPNDPLLCCGWTMSRFQTRPRSFWRGIASRLQFIVPSPMSSVTGMTKAGHPSEHCEANTGPRRFLVVEQDKGSADEQAAVILHLAMKAPLALAVFSGKKSIHAWFYCQGQDEKTLRAFMESAVALGADSATWNKTQFCRMPDGTREGGARQVVYYYNPEVSR